MTETIIEEEVLDEEIIDEEQSTPEETQIEEAEKAKCGTYTQYFREIISDNPATVARFFLMCTYLNFGDDTLMYKKRPMDKSTLRKVLRLKEDTFLDFFNELEINDIIRVERDRIKVNPRYSKRGRTETKSIAIIRCFDRPIRRLFETVDARKHKHLGYILMLIPYMHKYTNFLCKVVNIDDSDELKSTIYKKDEKDMVFMSMTDICKLLNYDVSNASRLRKELCSFQVDGEFLFTFAWNGNDQLYPIINDVFFFGCDWKKKESVHKTLFKAKSK